MTPAEVAVARAALDRFRVGWATGSRRPFLELLAEGFCMRVPIGALRGRTVGREEAAHHFQALRLARVRLALGEPTTVAVGERSVLFELEVSGTLYDLPYRNRLAFAFDVEGERVTGLREYFGELDRSLLARALE